MRKTTKQAAKKNGKAKKAAKAAKRTYRLDSEKLAAIKAAKGQPNPYREGSSYHAVVAALAKLGLGKTHSWDRIILAVMAVLADNQAATAFKKKEARNDNGLGWRDRIIQNVRVVARKDYGAKLSQVGYQVRTDGSKGAGIFKV